MLFIRRSRQHVDAGDVRDHELADRLPDLQHTLELAIVALREGYLARVPPSEIRSRYRAVSAAYDAAIAACEAGHRIAVGPTEGLSRTRVIAARGRPAARAWRQVLERLRTARQEHLLDASPASGVLVPTCVRVSSRAALGPHIPGMDFDPAPPLGPLEQRTYGVDLAAVMEARVVPPRVVPPPRKPSIAIRPQVLPPQTVPGLAVPTQAPDAPEAERLSAGVA